MFPNDHKARLRKEYRARRRDHVASLPEGVRALILHRPPAPIADMMLQDAVVGLYYPVGAEAPTLGWIRWLAENGRRIALPGFASRESHMEFREWPHPFDEESLELSPWGGLQPPHRGEPVIPDLVVVPLVAFTKRGERLGQGGGHYDRWLDANPQTPAIGLAWDCQIADALPVEDHDRHLAAVVTPTRIYEGSH
jgi:5-formyltetrahydrofolate cyclo-ligase